MTDPDPPLSPPPAVDAEAVARQRHFAIALFRLSGAFIVMFGFLALMQRFSWVQGTKAKAFGGIMVMVGLFQYIVVPRLMLALFRRTKP